MSSFSMYGNWCWHCNSGIIDGEPRVAIPHRNPDKQIEIHKSCERSYYIGIIKSWFGR